MLRNTSLCRAAVLLGGVLSLAAGCSSPASPSGSGSSFAVNGSWTGTALLPNAYTTTMTLQQTGMSVTGTMRIAGVIGTSPITGTVASGNRTFTWQVNSGCEVWSGTLTVASGNSEMKGPLTINRTGCIPARSSGSGTLSMDKN